MFSVQQLIAKEISDGIPAEKILIGGFSQGGAVALYTAFGTDVKIGGVVALSTWMPMNKYFTNDSVSELNFCESYLTLYFNKTRVSYAD